MTFSRLNYRLLASLAAGGLLLAPARYLLAQDGATGAPPSPMEDIVVVGRLKSSATDVALERMEQAVAADFLDAGQISRVGDSTVSLALRRLPGVTLVSDQFIYVRGLGERYSSTTLNGAFVPSPDLTRSVIPLDLFPAEIIDSLAVQKGYSADMPAAFGGGNIDIRTRTIPDDLVLDFQLGSGWNSESSEDGLKYAGGDDDWLGTDDGTRALPGAVSQAIIDTRGDVSAGGIFQALQRDGQNPGFADAEALNRQLATTLNRNVDFSDKSLDPDINARGAVGNSWYLDDSELWRVGGLALVDYGNSWRNRDRSQRSANDENVFKEVQRTINQVTLTGSASAGLSWGDEQQVEASYLYLRNTEDEAAISTGGTSNFQVQDGVQFRNYDIRYEERELDTWRVAGSHTLGEETRAVLEGLPGLDFLEDASFDWFYTESTAQTDIPNELRVNGVDQINPATGELLSTAVRQSSSAADYRFTDLEDEVKSYGWNVTYPFEVGSWFIEAKGGGNSYEKGRQLEQLRFGLGTTTTAANPILVGTPGQVFSDQNILDPINGFVFDDRLIGTESYLAAEKIDAGYGQIDATWNDTWRLNAGVRYEEFEQLSVPYNPLDFEGNKFLVNLETPADAEALATVEDDWYPAVAVTWMKNDFWAEEFQLRFGWSQTVARPDLREITPATYIDPLTEAIIRGNSGLMTADLSNFDIRGEWFFGNGDNFTVSLFYKDIADPIETIQDNACAPEDLCFTFVNGDSAEVYGVEVEWLKGLGFLEEMLGGWTDLFFLAGNVTLSDSEIDLRNVSQNVSSPQRRLAQHSEYVVNFQLGFDSPNEKHAATLVYNTFGERLFFGAVGDGASDAFEQPFDSMDFIYSWYPSNLLTVKLRLQNILDDEIEIEQGGVTIFEQMIGTTWKLDFTFRF